MTDKKRVDHLPQGATRAPTPAGGDPSVYYYYPEGEKPDTRPLCTSGLSNGRSSAHKPKQGRNDQTWFEMCNNRIKIPPPQPKGGCVLSAQKSSQNINTDYLAYERVDTQKMVSETEHTDYKVTGGVKKALQHDIDEKGSHQAYSALHNTPMGQRFADLCQQRDLVDTAGEVWNPNRLFARGMSKNWHQSDRRDPVAPTKYQNPRSLSFNEIDIESHLSLHCPMQKTAFDSRFVTKVLLPGGNLRKCYVKLDWDREIIIFKRRGQPRYYPLRYLTGANDSYGVLNHMILTGALSDLLEIDKRNFCSVFMSNLQHPLLLVFGSLRRKEYFVTLCQHVIEYFSSKDFLFYPTTKKRPTRRKIVDERRSAVATLPLLEIFKNELEDLQALEIEAKFEKGVQAAILTGRHLTKGCTIKFEAGVAKLSIVHPTGRSQFFPLEYITALEVEGDSLLAVGDDTAAEQAEEFFEDFNTQTSGPQGFTRTETIRRVGSHVDGKAPPVTTLTKSPTRRIGESTQDEYKREASRDPSRSSRVRDSSRSSRVRDSSRNASQTSLQRLRTDPQLSRLTTNAISDLADRESPTFVALTIKGCSSPLVLIFNSSQDRDHFIILVQVLQVIFLCNVADTDESLKFKRDEQKFVEVEDAEFDEKLKDDNIDEAYDETEEPEDARVLPSEPGIQFRYLRPGSRRPKADPDFLPMGSTSTPTDPRYSVNSRAAPGVK